MRFRRGCRGFWLVPLAFALDRLTKILVTRSGSARTLIPGILRCRPVRNSGMAFSLLSGQTWLLIAATSAVLLGLLVYLLMKPDEHPLTRTGFWLIIGGGLGNLFDRVAYGSVIDFLELIFVRFAIFNVADVFVCAGAALAVLGMILAERKGGK